MSEKRYTVGRLARRFGLSRSTLLYYDSIGLLHPEGRAPGEYRQYGDEAVRRLERICRYKAMGLSLKQIAAALDSETSLAAGLTARLEQLNDEIESLREQQRLILRMLNVPDLEKRVVMSRTQWTTLLRAGGLSDEDMRRWHISFERHSPEEHQRFLEFLCIPKDEIEVIRGWNERDALGD